VICWEFGHEMAAQEPLLCIYPLLSRFVYFVSIEFRSGTGSCRFQIQTEMLKSWTSHNSHRISEAEESKVFGTIEAQPLVCRRGGLSNAHEDR